MSVSAEDASAAPASSSPAANAHRAPVRRLLTAVIVLVGFGWWLWGSGPRPSLPASAVHASVASVPLLAVAGRSRARRWRLVYEANNETVRRAVLLLPAWYGTRDDPPLPLIISPHGRGTSAQATCRLWGNLPAVGRFAVVCPAGQGTHLGLFSWGAPAQIGDLARMASIVERNLPWVHIARQRIYAVGGSMGGQEVLLLLAHHPRFLRGVIAFDPVASLARQWAELPLLPCNRHCRRQWDSPLGIHVRQLLTTEVGGTPSEKPHAYAARSPLTYAAAIAHSDVPLELWWSLSDRVIRHQQTQQSGPLFRRILHLNPTAPVEAFVGDWIHSHEQHATTRLPFALAQLGLLPRRYLHRPSRLQTHHFIPRATLALGS